MLLSKNATNLSLNIMKSYGLIKLFTESSSLEKLRIGDDRQIINFELLEFRVEVIFESFDEFNLLSKLFPLFYPIFYILILFFNEISFLNTISKPANYYPIGNYILPKLFTNSSYDAFDLANSINIVHYSSFY